jgi:metal-dependent amidase/aminoacylase/carboxypeptidase family protein
MAKLVRSVAVEELSCKQDIVSFISLAGEDFWEFAARIPGAFYFLGVGKPEKETQYPHHHPRFNIDEDALKVGVEMHVRAALRYLNM